MEETPYDYNEPQDAKFNMAIDTLRRIGSIFEHIKNLYLDYRIPDEKKQAIKVQLVKQLFIQSSPLLEVSTVEEYQTKILALVPKQTKTYRERNGSSTKYVGRSISFNQELDVELDTIVIKLQQELQKKKCFMPPADDDEGL